MLPTLINNLSNFVYLIAILTAFFASLKYVFYLYNKSSLNVVLATSGQNYFDRFIGTIIMAVIINSAWNFIIYFIGANKSLNVYYTVVLIVSALSLLITFALTFFIKKYVISLIIFLSGILFLLSYIGSMYSSLKISIIEIYVSSTVFAIIISYAFLKSVDFYEKLKRQKYKTTFIRDKQEVEVLLDSLQFIHAIDIDHYSYNEVINTPYIFYDGPHYIYYVKENFFAKIEKQQD